MVDESQRAACRAETLVEQGFDGGNFALENILRGIGRHAEKIVFGTIVARRLKGGERLSEQRRLLGEYGFRVDAGAQALLLILLFTLQLHWLPARGYVPLNDNPVDSLKHFAMPVMTLAAGGMAGIVRQTRSAMLEVMKEDYIRTAKAKGLPSSAVILGHAMKNALLPIVTISGLQIGRLVSGSIIIESVFGIPGMGSLTITAVRQSDYNVIQILVLLFALMTILGNLLADIAYTRLDPRIRLG